jgi:hypothetical protein
LSERAALALCLQLAACGFQLRGEPTVGLHTLFVSNSVPSTVVADIRRILATGPTKVVASEKEGEASLRILGESREKTVNTITGIGASFKDQTDKLERRIVAQEERHTQLIKDLPAVYAYREDMIRYCQDTNSRLDKVQDLLLELIRGGK